MIPTLQDALAERGYDSLTSVQEAVTDPELADADLLVSAQTGSGKTVGFGLAIAPTLMGEAGTLGPAAAPLALVVAPTRELALQVARELGWLYAKAGARIATCIGGMDARDERRALERGAHIVVGTPGRLRDHIARGALELDAIRAVVLDEADEMLDLGFREDLEYMLGEAPEERRTLLFSATVPRSIEEMARTYQRDAVRVTTLDKGSQHSDISYQAVQVAQGDEENAIINLLRFHDAPTAIVFANTRAAVTRLSARLANRGFLVASLSGELSQDERSHALQSMRDGRARVCVATDVAARGIDLPNLDLVIHADLPQSTEALLHRSGRTGRAGRKGISALIANDRAVNKANRILKWAKVQAEWVAAPSADEILDKDEARLLEDEAWTQEPSEREAAFAAKLIEAFTPEQIAAACFRLYQNKLSAPEELNVAPVRAPREERERREFGPSIWAKLSIGRDQNAEPRWILPLLCRAGGLDKTQIGKIRVLDTATYVELAEAVGPDLGARLGDGGVLEEDVRLELVDSVPEEVTRARPPRRDDGPRPLRAPRRDDGPRPPRPARREEGEFRPKKRDFAKDGERGDFRPKKRDFSRDGDRDDRPKKREYPREGGGEYRSKPRDFDRKEGESRPRPAASAKPKETRFGDTSKSFRRPDAGEHSKTRRVPGDKPRTKRDAEGGKPPFRAKSEGFRPKSAPGKPRPGGPGKPGKKY
ncbi:DEAD/DEAH box helicase [Mangrovicoccus algicola]|uniref:DEAD/DEAH box helicase n=1 Tax=Mangrovicoccus algicola TaxID=2771008 RepID=A0A8J7CXN2_9RHOB|nr:DEAD/DEAH box helicase [Mangrovicoccus algicola]MBE3639147.1 DEAD/DEAH box helicase [Mangrovicoccus algicola]